MVALPQTYSVDAFPETGGVTLIPEGKYQAIAVHSELKANSKNTGHFLQIKFVVTQGDYRDTEFTENLNIINPNETAVKIAYQTLAKISRAVGLVQTPDDSVQLHNKPLLLEVKTEAGKNWVDDNGVERKGADKSAVKGYHVLPAAGLASGQSFASQPVAQQAAMPQQAAQSFPTNPFKSN